MTMDASGPVSPEFPAVAPPDHLQILTDGGRLAALSEAGVLDKSESAVLDRLCHLATQAIGVPVSLVSFVAENRQVFAAQVGLTGPAAADRETPLSHSFCQYVVSSDQPLAVSDARNHPLLADNGAVDDLDVIAYLGVPVHDAYGETLGSFCAIDSKPRNWTERERSILRDLTTMVETELRLRREVKERDLLAREINHRIKNLFALVGGIVGLSARTAETPAEVAEIVKGRLHALSQAHEVVSPVPAAGLGQVNAPAGLRALAGLLLQPHVPVDDMALRIRMEGPDVMLGQRSVTSIALALHELATNASKYGCFSVPDGRLDLTWTEMGEDRLRLVWREHGTTPGAAPTRPGFGSRLVEMSVTGSLRGTVETAWHDDGMEWRAEIPLSVLSR